MNFSIIAAVDQNLGIGINNRLPWHLPSDLKHFNEITTGNKKNAVVMGLNTWKSLPEKFRPLPNRINIILSKNPEMNLPNRVLSFQSLDAALSFIEGKVEEVFIIGGGMLYDSAINHPNCSKLYLTEISQTFACDSFFPEIPAVFKKTSQSPAQTENNISFVFAIYKKI